jgi:cytochrome c biogenesis protein CcdA
VLVVLTSGRGRLNGTAFAVGFVTGQAVVFLLALTIGGWSPLADTDHHTEVQAILAIAFGGALLAAATYIRRRGGEPLASVTPKRTGAVRDRLTRLRPATAVGTGVALGVGGPKRLSITLVATATIAAGHVSDLQEAVLGTVYVLSATVLVWVPVALYLVFGDRGATWLNDLQTWIGAHKEPLTFYPSVVLGIVLVADGLIQLSA